MSDSAPTGRDQAYLWVLIESGSNQDFIFRSPKRRYNVGASALLLQLACWVREAAKSLEGTTVVVATSGKALVKVPDQATGVQLIRSVTTKALIKAPGLDIWGVVEDANQVGLSLGERIAKLHIAHRDARYGRPTPHRRALLLPFSQACSMTGIAAEAIGSPMDGKAHGKKGQDKKSETGQDQKKPVPLSAQARAILAGAGRRYERLKELYDGKDEYAGQILEPSSEDASEDGWVAIVHADGNHVGQLMRAITTEEQLGAVSTALEDATAAALRAAIREVGGPQPGAPWALPLIVGGDDVTVIVEGARALRFADSYLRHFESETARRECLSSLAAADAASGGFAWITASAGVLVCHAKTPFSLAYTLAEQAIHEAKHVRELAPGRSAFAFFCAGDSIPDAIGNVGKVLVDQDANGPREVRTRGQVYVVKGQPGADEGRSESDMAWLAAHGASHLLEAVAALVSEQPPLSGSRVSEIRMQLGAGHVRASTIHRAEASSPAAQEFIAAHLVVPDRELSGGARADSSDTEPVVDDDPAPHKVTAFTRWLDINDAVSLTRGKVEAPPEATRIAPAKEKSA